MRAVFAIMVLFAAATLVVGLASGADPLIPEETAGAYAGSYTCKGNVVYEGLKPEYNLKWDSSTADVEVSGSEIMIDVHHGSVYIGRWIQDPRKPGKITFGAHWRDHAFSASDHAAVYRGEIVKRGNGSYSLKATGIHHNKSGHNEHSTCTWNFTKPASQP